jgi:hypothetical protein
MKTIPLGNSGEVALVDDSDFERVAGIAWSICKVSRSGRCYVRAKIGHWKHPKFVYLHRFILSAAADQKVDHANLNTLDCRRENLRICSSAENNRNRSVNAVKGFKGIWKHRKRFQAGLQYDGRRIYLGTFDTEIQAAQAYNTAAKHWFGEFARLNQL